MKKKGITFLTLLMSTALLVGCNPNLNSSSSQKDSSSSLDSSHTANEEVYWSVSFDLNYEGAPLIEGITVRGNSLITAPEFNFSPEGDSFLGWYHDQYSLVKWSFTRDKITANRTLYAGWQSIVDSSSDGEVPPPNETDEYDYYDPDFFPTTHTVTFDSNYENGPIVVRHVIEGLKAKAPSITRKGFLINGWYYERSFETLYNFDLPITSELALYAKWEPLTAYNITLDLNYSGAPNPTTVVGYGGMRLDLPETPIRDQYDFLGWYKDITLTSPWNFSFDLIEGEMVLYAKWSRLPLPGVYVVVSNSWAEDNATFMLWHGAGTVDKVGEATGIKNEYYFDNVATNYLALKRRVGANMVGQVYNIAPSGGFGATWNQIVVKDTTPKTGSLMENDTTYVLLQLRDNSVDENLTTYNVTFNFNYPESPLPIIKEVRDGQKVELPVNPVRENYDFTGWYYEANATTKFNIDSAITMELELYAGWEYIDPSEIVNITFDYNYEDAPVPFVQSVRKGQTLTAPLITRTGYTLDGWYKEISLTNKWNFNNDTVSVDLTLYAKWNKNEEIQKDGVFVLMNEAWMLDDATFVMEMPGGKKIDGIQSGPNEFFFEGVPTNAIHLVRNVNGTFKAKIYNIAVWQQSGPDYRNFGTIWNRVVLRSDLANNLTNEPATNAVTYDLRP